MQSPDSRSQRWRERRQFWRRPDDIFDPSRYSVDVAGEKAAKLFVETHHYSGSYPAARLPVGLFEGSDLVGVAVFSVPMGAAVIEKWTNFGMEGGVELGRFVLLDRVPANAETWFLARAFDVLTREKAGLRAVVAFSDPLPRQAADGRIVMPGHVGGIYRASNALFAGRTTARKLWLDADGQVISERALVKLRRGERGAGYVYEKLRAADAPAIEPGEGGAAYVSRALLEGPFRHVRHPGNLGYLFAVGGPAQRRATRKIWEETVGEGAAALAA
jgi:hypothetical protein